MSCTSGCAPVAIDARQTGVSEGNVDDARRYSPCSARKRSAGVSAASNIDGVRPSITTSTTGFGAIDCSSRARASAARRGVSGARRRSACAEQRHGEGLEIADDGDERERGADERGERRGAPRCRPACRRAAAFRRRAAPSRASRRRAPTSAADRLVPLPEDEADRDCDRRGDHEPGERAPERAGRRDTERAPSPTRSPIVYQSPTGGQCSSEVYTEAPTAGIASRPVSQELACRTTPGPCWSSSRRPLRARRAGWRAWSRTSRARSAIAYGCVQVDVDERAELVEKLEVNAAPTLVLVVDRKPVARIEGRASAPSIEAMIEEHLDQGTAAG